MSPLQTQALPPTLAQRVQYLREHHLGITQDKLAEKANLPSEVIQDIEAGIEMFLSSGIRQKLARALKVAPAILKAVEKQPQPKNKPLSAAEQQALLNAVLQQPDSAHYCPQCHSELHVRLFDRQDIEDMPLIEAKVHCTQCLFKM